MVVFERFQSWVDFEIGSTKPFVRSEILAVNWLSDWLNQTSYTDDQIAHYGGITINIMENGGIPVHYHITSSTSDPPVGHSNPDEIISTTYTPEPNKPFIPEIPDGVEDGVIKQVVGLVDPTDDPHPYPYPKDPTSTVDDDDPFEVDTDPDDEPGNDDDIEEIHVWITEEPGVPVYLHTYIFEEADLADVDIDNPAEVIKWMSSPNNKNRYTSVSCNKIDSIPFSEVGRASPDSPATYTITNDCIIAALSTAEEVDVAKKPAYPSNISTMTNLTATKDYLAGKKLDTHVIVRGSRYSAGSDTMAKSIHLKTFQIGVPVEPEDQPPITPTPIDIYDRIKSQDVTQYITLTSQSTSHLAELIRLKLRVC